MLYLYNRSLITVSNMGLIAIRLDEETEAHLADILAHDRTDRSELIRRLINDRWVSLQAGQTVVERMGGHPKYLLTDAPSNLSERKTRKRAIADYLNKQAEAENKVLSRD